MASVSRNIKERYQSLEDTAPPTLFKGNDVPLSLSGTLQDILPQMPIKSPKRSGSALSDDHTASDESDIGYDDGYGTT